jgi:hypothetical protein
MAAKKILFLVGDFAEDYEVMVPFQALTMLGHSPLEGGGFELSVPGRAISDREFAPLAWLDRDFEPPAPSRVDLCDRTRTASGT